MHLSQVISHWVACEVLGKFMTRFCKFGKMVFKVYFGQIWMTKRVSYGTRFVIPKCLLGHKSRHVKIVWCRV